MGVRLEHNNWQSPLLSSLSSYVLKVWYRYRFLCTLYLALYKSGPLLVWPLNYIEYITGIVVPLDPELSLLGNLTKVSLSVNKRQVKFIEVALCVARKRIATTLRSASPLNIMYHYIQQKLYRYINQDLKMWPWVMPIFFPFFTVSFLPHYCKIVSK